MIILQDSREQNPIIFPKDIDVHICTLETGDYSVASEKRNKYTGKDLDFFLTIERKGAVCELAGNLTKKRFKDELERMAEYRHKFLLLEFSFYDILRFPYGSSIPKRRWKYLKVKPKFIISCLNSISIRYGVHVIYAGDADGARYIATDLIQKVYKLYENK